MKETGTTSSRRSLLRILAVSAGFWGLSGPIVSSVWAKTIGAGRPLTELRIGYQKSAVNLVLIKQQGVLEKRFPDAEIKWVDFPAGPQLLEALAVGSLEFGLTGDSPPVFAQAAGKDLVYVGAEPAKPESSAILVGKDSAIKTLADLKGKKVALQKGSSAHYLLVQAVAKAGLQWADIQPIYLAPADARAAFERNSVDAWAIWDPFYAATELSIAPRVLTTGTGLSSNNSFYLASRRFATDYPDVLAALFEELTRADQFVQQHRPQAIKLISSFSGLDAGVVSLFLQRRPPSPVGPITTKTVAQQQQVADTFKKLGLIPKPVQVADIVWKPKSTVLVNSK
ncbi:MAG: sulfonate ABC transporter substrate-binding protein [Rhodoferax sp.]